MSYRDLAARLPNRWREDFLRFVKTGEAEEPFLEYLDRDPSGQKAVQAAFAEQASAFKRMAHQLRPEAAGDGVSHVEVDHMEVATASAAGAGRGPTDVDIDQVHVETVSIDLARSVTAAASLPAEERRRTTATVADVLRAQGHAVEAFALVSDLEDDLERAH